MKVYRVRHKETNLYYTPVRGIVCKYGNHVKSNLSARGKLYTKKPNIKSWIGNKVYSHLDNHVEMSKMYRGTARGEDTTITVPIDGWIIEEFEFSEKPL